MFQTTNQITIYNSIETVLHRSYNYIYNYNYVCHTLHSDSSQKLPSHHFDLVAPRFQAIGAYTVHGSRVLAGLRWCHMAVCQWITPDDKEYMVI